MLDSVNTTVSKDQFPGVLKGVFYVNGDAEAQVDDGSDNNAWRVGREN